MTRTEALTALSSPSTHTRLKAARVLSRECELEDLSALRKQRRRETDLYVIGALDRAIVRAKRKGPAPVAKTLDMAEPEDDVRRELYAQAVRWISGVLLHELQGPIGLIDAAAAREVPDYPKSVTRQRLETVKGRFTAIENLQLAATAAKPTRFDLAAFIDKVIFDEVPGGAEELDRYGPNPLEVNADPRLLALALSNGLRNAVEASANVQGNPEDGARVVVSWGGNDVDVWISIVDRGPGLPGSSDRVFDVGQTTKDGHQGFGLTIARQAMDSLGGTVVLTNSREGGARFELRWEQ